MPGLAALLTLLSAYTPAFICLACLTTILERDPSVVSDVVTEHIRNGDLEARDSRECMNCNRKAFAVRVKPRPRLRSRTA